MKIIFAPDSFKGSLSAGKVCELLEKEARRAFPGCETVSLPVSDGGEGAVDVVVPSVGGRIIPLTVHGPLGAEVTARYGLFSDGSVLIEMASASGLPLVKREERDILRANTYGTGELIRRALEDGCRSFFIAIGGSATNDGGIGCASALGVQFLDDRGMVLEPVPMNLGRIAKIDFSKAHPALGQAEFTVMCDVKNPLTGPNGATAVFGPQKGGREDQLQFLENGMCHYEELLRQTFGKDIGQVPGAGAAGGLGAGLMAFAGAKLQPGIDTILKILRFEELLPGTNLVITGEGQIDEQSAFGKVPFGVGKLCKAYGVPCAAIVGSIGRGAEKMEEYGISGMMPIVPAPMTLSEAMDDAEQLFSKAAHRMFEMIKIGMKITV